MKNLLSLLFLLSPILFFAQNSWKQEYSSSKVFIENKGQFDANKNKLIGEIQFAADFGSTRVFFGKKGVSYSFLNAKKVPKNEREHLSAKLKLKTTEDYKQWEKVIGKFHYKADEVNMTWENANYSNIKAEGQRSDYHSYSYLDKARQESNVNYVKGFSKITYKNIYPKIDIEYNIHPQEGLKYAVILHPGANPDDVKMVYDRAVRIENGKVKVATLFGDIVDHEPFTFYQKNTNAIIKSEFVQIGQTIKFKLGNYDNKKTVVIDPWTQTPAFPSNWDCIWEVEKDAAGNVYAIGGITPMQLLKYDPNGSLLWTYNTPYDTTGGSWLGGFATSDIGNSYVCNGSATKILCVNTNGGITWNNNNPSGAGATSEFWTISFNCDQTKLVVGGTKLLGLNPSPWIYDVNMSNGNILASVQVSGTPSGFGVGHEVRALTECNNNKYYYLSHDTIGYINSNLNSCGSLGGSNVKIGSGHNFSYKNENFREGNSGIQALKTFGNFVYVHRGDIVEKRNFNTGAIVGTANIPGGSFINTSTFGIVTRQVGCSGIDIDDCGNVYVGATNGVVKFNQNLVQQATYPTSFKVYDVHVTTSGNIIAGGSSGTSDDNTRSGGIQHINAAACAPIAITCCDASICPIQNQCVSGAPITLTAATAGGTWSGPGMSANGTFNPSTAGTGTHTITYTLPCGSETQTIIVSPCQTLNACIESNGSITVSNGLPTYTWATYQAATNTPITTQAQCTSCGYTWFFGQCLNGASPATSCNSPAQWVNFATGTNATAPSGTTQVQVTDGSGTVTTFTISSLAQCNTTPCPTITVSSSNVNNVSCNGGSNGTATVSASGGTAPYTYSWTPGSLTGATQTALSPNIYTVTATDVAQCTGSTTITITQPTIITLTSSNINPAVCGSNNGSATINASGGAGTYTYSWSPAGGTAATGSNLASGNYVVTVTDGNNCPKTLNITIPTSGGPNITNIVTVEPSCLNINSGQISVTASGGNGTLSYQINSGTAQASNLFSNLSAGNYTITVTDANNCSNSIDTALHLPIPIQLAQGTIVGADCGVSNGSATVSASSGSGNYTYSWVPSGQTTATATNLAAGVYDAIVTDSQSGCKDTLEFIVQSIGGPSITNITANSPTCNGGSNGSLVVTATGGTAPYNYVIGAGIPQSGSTLTNLSAGTYQVTVTDANGCPATQNQVITNPSAVVANAGIVDTICVGQNTTLTASGNGGTGTLNYTWSNNLPGMNPNVSPTSTTNYSLTVTDANGCTGTSSVQIVVLPVPNAQANPSVTTGNYPLAVTFANTSSNATSYVWDFGNGLTQVSPTNAAVSSTYNTVGTFNVILIATNGQCTDTWTGTITTLPIGVLVFEVPNVFSPNGDTSNETYGITSINAASQEVVIVNRWGVKMVELNTPNTYWDGKTSNGAEASDGVYFMKYRIKGLDGSEKEGQTFLHLIR